MATHGSSSEDDGDDGDDGDSSSDEEVESMVAEYVKKIFKYVKKEPRQNEHLRKKVNMYGYNVHLRKVSYGPPWAHYLGGYQDRLLGGPLGLPGLRYMAPDV
jgi:hypothetical protein